MEVSTWMNKENSGSGFYQGQELVTFKLLFFQGLIFYITITA